MIQRQLTRPMSRAVAGSLITFIKRSFPKAHCHITWNPAHAHHCVRDTQVRVVVLNCPINLPMAVAPLGA